MLTSMATVLWACKFEKERDPVSGEEIPVDVNGFLDAGLAVYVSWL